MSILDPTDRMPRLHPYVIRSEISALESHSSQYVDQWNALIADGVEFPDVSTYEAELSMDNLTSKWLALHPSPPPPPPPLTDSFFLYPFLRVKPTYLPGYVIYQFQSYVPGPGYDLTAIDETAESYVASAYRNAEQAAFETLVLRIACAQAAQLDAVMALRNIFCLDNRGRPAIEGE